MEIHIHENLFTKKENTYTLTETQLEIIRLSVKTGLSEDFLIFCFNDSPQNLTITQKIINGFFKKYNFNDYNNTIEEIYDFIFNISGLSNHFLVSINANNPSFYSNFSLTESLNVIISRMVGDKENAPSKNNFPVFFNFKKGQENTVLTIGGSNFFPVINNFNINFGKLKASILKSIGVKESSGYKILYHGTSWTDSIEILEEVRTTTRGECTDFGMNNFYTTNLFYTACEWALRNNDQGSVVVFVIPDDKFYELEVKYLTNTQEWRDVVYTLRNKPKRIISNNYEEEIEKYRNILKEYESYDAIEGPIMSNPSAKSLESVEFIVNNDNKIPLKVSFKNSSVGILNQYIALTVTFSMFKN